METHTLGSLLVRDRADALDVWESSEAKELRVAEAPAREARASQWWWPMAVTYYKPYLGRTSEPLDQTRKSAQREGLLSNSEAQPYLSFKKSQQSGKEGAKLKSPWLMKTSMKKSPWSMNKLTRHVRPRIYRIKEARGFILNPIHNSIHQRNKQIQGKALWSVYELSQPQAHHLNSEYQHKGNRIHVYIFPMPSP